LKTYPYGAKTLLSDKTENCNGSKNSNSRIIPSPPLNLPLPPEFSLISNLFNITG